MADDARYRTKVFIDTYITDGNITKDDDTTEASWISQFSNPPYPMKRVFFSPKNVDLVFSIDMPRSEAAKVDWDGYTIGYLEHVPVHIHTVTKQGITDNKLLWKAHAELRRILEANPLGSYRGYSSGEPYIISHGIWQIMGVTVTVAYERDTS